MKRLFTFLAGAVAGLAGLVGAGVVAARRRAPTQELTARTEASADTPAEEKRHSESEPARDRLRTLVKHFALFLLVLAVGGLLVAASGIVSIKASSGHWAITRWFLEFGSSRSVATHTIGLDAPSLDSLRSPALVLKGAGHYEFGCRPCHGSPELPHPRVAQAMTPHPPYLPPEISKWEPGELFYIVKHGLKFTGMPAWPTQERDDEVWAMVGFLLRLPSLDAEGYRRLARGEAAEGAVAPMDAMGGPMRVPAAVTESCARCHGTDGLGRGTGAFPILAGQRPAYLYASLVAFARGERHSGVMEPIAAGLSRDEMRALARYYAAQDPPAPLSAHALAAVPDSEAVTRGEAIARRGVPSRRTPACADCHGPAPTRRNPIYPILAGQYADYLVLQLRLFKHEQRGGTPYAHLMREAADRLTAEEMRDVALYYASLVAEADTSSGLPAVSTALRPQ